MSIQDIIAQLGQGMLTSVLIYALTLIGAVPLALPLALARGGKSKIARLLTGAYISFMRGTPLMLQLLIIYYGPGILFDSNIWGGGANGRLTAALAAAGIRTEIDEREQSVGWKFNDCELRGIPVRIELGPKDLEQGQVVAVRRDTFEKIALPWEGLAEKIVSLLEEIHANMFAMAKAYRDAKIFPAKDFDEFRKGIDEGKGFVRAPWCGETACELEIKAETGATTRCMPLDEHEVVDGVCVHCGKPAKKIMYFGRSY